MKVSRVLIATLLLATVAVNGNAAPAQGRATSRVKAHAKAHDTQAALAAEAKVNMATARATALAKVPGGVIKSSELEREGGKLIYSFAIKVAGKSGIEEVNVNAIDGSVVAMQHESVRTEQKELQQERAELKKGPSSTTKPPATK